MSNKKTYSMTSLLIGLCFFWTGTGYLTWFYRLSDFCSASQVDILTEVVGYIFQVIGLISAAFLIKKNKSFFESKYIYVIMTFLDVLFISMAALAWDKVSCLSFGYVMNFFHGIIAATYLFILVKNVPANYRGRAFGIGYAFGSVSSYLLSAVDSSNFLQNNLALIVYIVAAVLSIPVFLACIPENNMGVDLKNQEDHYENNSFTIKFIVSVAVLIFLLSAIKNTGFYFPTADLSDSGISLEFSRLFYAVGLVIAGFIGDYSRKHGAICCVAALVFPFVMLVLVSQVSISMVLWISGYFFFGFFVVYRVLLFADIAARSEKLIFLSCFGLLFGRIGDATGALSGILLKDNMTVLVVCAAALFVFTIFLFFEIFQRLYLADNTIAKEDKDIWRDIIEKYELTPREADVLKLIEKSLSNAEIAAELFISENTVKFHMKNILKKTGCSNRAEIISMLK